MRFVTWPEFEVFNCTFNRRLAAATIGRGMEITRTINIDNTMDHATIQGIFDDIKKVLAPGVTVNVNCADGIYNMTDALDLSGFLGGGRLNLNGNPADTSLAAAKSVEFRFTNDTNGLEITRNQAFITVNNIAIRVNNASVRGVLVQQTIPWVIVLQCSVYGVGIHASNRGVIALQQPGSVQVRTTYFANLGRAIEGDRGGFVYSDSNGGAVGATECTYGLYARGATVICKNGTQPTGSTANEYFDRGGDIR